MSFGIFPGQLVELAVKPGEADDVSEGFQQHLSVFRRPIGKRWHGEHEVEHFVTALDIADVLGDAGQQLLQRRVTRVNKVVGVHGRHVSYTPRHEAADTGTRVGLGEQLHQEISCDLRVAAKWPIHSP